MRLSGKSIPAYPWRAASGIRSPRGRSIPTASGCRLMYMSASFRSSGASATWGAPVSCGYASSGSSGRAAAPSRKSAAFPLPRRLGRLLLSSSATSLRGRALPGFIRDRCDCRHLGGAGGHQGLVGQCIPWRIASPANLTTRLKEQLLARSRGIARVGQEWNPRFPPQVQRRPIGRNSPHPGT